MEPLKRPLGATAVACLRAAWTVGCELVVGFVAPVRPRSLTATVSFLLAVLLGGACVVSCEREFSYHDGLSRSVTLCWGRVVFARYSAVPDDIADPRASEPPTEFERTNTFYGVAPNPSRYLELRFGRRRLNTQSYGLRAAAWYRFFYLWNPVLRERWYVFGSPTVAGGMTYPWSGTRTLGMPGAQSGAWCYRESITVSLRPWAVLTAVLAMITCPPLLFRSIRSCRWRRQGRCQSCGYDLTGNVSGRCSECGSALRP